MGANSFLVRYAGGWAERKNVASIFNYGRLEALLGLGAVSSLAEVNRVADGQLTDFKQPREQTDILIEPRYNSEAPYIGFQVGDTINVAGDDHRVLALSVTEDQATDRVIFVPTLNENLVLNAQERVAQSLTKMVRGTVGGQSKVAQPVVPAFIPKGRAAAPVVTPEFESFVRDAENSVDTLATDTANFAAFELYLLAVAVYDNTSSTPPTVTSVTTTGLTWDSVDSILYDDVGIARGRLNVYRAMPTANVSDTVTVTLSGSTAVLAFAVIRVVNADTSGTNGSGAIIQTVTNSGSSSTPSATLAALTGSHSSVGFFALNANGAPSDLSDAFTAGTDYMEIGEFGAYREDGSVIGAANLFCAAEYAAPGSATVDGTFYASNNWGVVALELASITG